MEKIFLLSIMLIGICITQHIKLDFFQNEYDVKPTIAECVWYDKSVFRFFNASFVPYNRTQRVLNMSYYLLKELRNDLKLDVQVYKFSSNEYRFFPITVSLNVCAEYFRNSCDVKTILARVSNIDLCNMKKGYYFIKNGLPDYSKFPPHIPRGLYKMVFEYKYQENYYAKLDFYGEVKDKPIDWKKIPKRRN